MCEQLPVIGHGIKHSSLLGAEDMHRCQPSRNRAGNPHFDVFPAFPYFSENVPHFWLYVEKPIFLIIVIILGARKKLCA